MTDPRKTVYHSPDFPEGFPFCQAVVANGFVFCSGAIGHERGAFKLVEGGVAAETQMALTYLKETLEAVGSGLHKVVKATVFYTLATDFPEINRVYTTFFPNRDVARSSFVVTALALGASVEIECIALA